MHPPHSAYCMKTPMGVMRNPLTPALSQFSGERETGRVGSI